MVCHLWAIALATINLPIKLEVSNSTHYEEMQYKISKMGLFGVVSITRGHWK